MSTNSHSCDKFLIKIAMALPTPQELQYQILHKDDDRSSALYITAGTMIVLPALSVMVRLACRRHLKYPIAFDDIAIVISLVSPPWSCNIRIIGLKLVFI